MQGEFSSPPSRFRARHLVGGLLLLAVLGGLAREWVLRRSEPRYLGRTEREWFPVWSQRFPGAFLTNAAPEALPMFLAAIRRQDSPLLDWWNGIAGRFPDIQGVELRGVNAFQVQFSAMFALLNSAARSDFASELMGRFDSLPLSDRQLILQHAGYDRIPMGTIQELSPLLIRILNRADDQFAVLAGSALARNPVLARPHAARIIAVVASEVRKARAEQPSPRYLSLIGDLGPISPAATRPLVSLVDPSKSWKQIALLLALSRLDPENFPPNRFLAGATDRANLRARIVALGTLLDDKLREPSLPADFAVFLEVFLRFDGFFEPADDASSRRILDPFRALSILHRLSRRPLDSPRLQLAILGGVNNPSPEIRRGSAGALAQARNLTPEAIDRAAALLLEGWEPHFMLKVFLNARLMPHSVRGLVLNLASGDTKWFLPTVEGRSADRLNRDLGFVAAPANWDPKPTLSDEFARRIGLPPIRDSLPVLAKDLLQRVEEAGGSGVLK